jgi:UDP-N-acetylglucosamine 4-epimerase
MFEKAFHSEDISDKKFLVTGGAGFVGSNLVEYLLKHGAGEVRVLDNLSNGYHKNIQDFLTHPNFRFTQADMLDEEVCRQVCQGVHIVFHQAALGSVPRSIRLPLATNAANITGFLNMLVAAKDAGVERFVYASSSSVYGDSPILPKVETHKGNPLSPYAVTKQVNELYAKVFGDIYGIKTIGLRYFNIFGPRQNPKNPYAAVIPLFIYAILDGKAPSIHGDGSQTRDFTFVENAVQANICAAFTKHPEAFNKVYNVAVGDRISLLDLYAHLANIAGSDIQPAFIAPRPGDIHDSLADISQAQQLLGYQPQVNVRDGLKILFDWYKQNRSFIEAE